jgi:hypothetical protein
MTSPRASRHITNSNHVDRLAKRGDPLSHHDMDPSLPADSPDNVVRKTQQVKARAAAARQIDKALAKVPVSDESKALRKARLINLPDGTPPKRRGKRTG